MRILDEAYDRLSAKIDGLYCDLSPENAGTYKLLRFFHYIMWSHIHRQRFSSLNFKFNLRSCSTKQEKDNEIKSKSPSIDDKDIPEAPSTCCMSACPNCVWIEYANQLNDIFRDGGETSLKIIEEKVTDPNMKAFLITELKIASMKK